MAKNTIIIQIKNLTSDLPIPSYAKDGDAGVDLYANIMEDVIIGPGDRKFIPCGIAIACPRGTQAEVRARSGLAMRQGISVLNSPGTVDSGYRSEIGVILFNASRTGFRVTRADRIAQLVFMPYLEATFEEVQILPESERGTDGFGSTGLKKG